VLDGGARPTAFPVADRRDRYPEFGRCLLLVELEREPALPDMVAYRLGFKGILPPPQSLKPKRDELQKSNATLRRWISRDANVRLPLQLLDGHAFLVNFFELLLDQINLHGEIRRVPLDEIAALATFSAIVSQSSRVRQRIDRRSRIESCIRLGADTSRLLTSTSVLLNKARIG
jgi:hypothetical protein